MIDPIPGWVCDFRQSGLILIPPEGPGRGAIRYHEQRRPLRRIGDVVAGLTTPDAYEHGAVGPVERFQTVEGEHAALVTIAGRVEDRAVERTVGMVVTGDAYSLTVGLALEPDEFPRFRAHVRELVERDTFMLGVRRRCFVYAPPPGWHAIRPTALHVKWLPVDYPRDRAALDVYPALPVPDGERSFAEAFVRLHAHGAEVDACDPVSTPWLSGGMWRVPSGELEQHVVVLEDDRYIYPVVLELPADRRDELETLRRVIDSIEPLPRPAGAAPRSAELFSQWCE